MLKSKRQQLTEALRAGNEILALRIAKGFFTGFDTAEKAAIDIAHESLNGSKAFYKSIGVDVKEQHKYAMQVLNEKFND